MNITTDKNERLAQREILKKEFAGYLPIHHDAFVVEYNRKIEKQKTEEYMKNRGIIQ
jgi:hypothetical protein